MLASGAQPPASVTYFFPVFFCVKFYRQRDSEPAGQPDSGTVGLRDSRTAGRQTESSMEAAHCIRNNIERYEKKVLISEFLKSKILAEHEHVTRKEHSFMRQVLLSIYNHQK